MANPATNKTSTDTRLVNQGARVTENDENKRINTASLVTGKAAVTENSENKRISTVVWP
jgi:hypothetical protein